MSQNHYHNPHNCNYYSTTPDVNYHEQSVPENNSYPEYNYQPQNPANPNPPAPTYYPQPPPEYNQSNKYVEKKANCIKILPRDFMTGCHPRLLNPLPPVVVEPTIPIKPSISVSFMNGHTGNSIGTVGNGFSLINNGSVSYQIEDTVTLTNNLGVTTSGNWINIKDVSERVSIYTNLLEILNSNSHIKYTCGVTDNSNMTGLGENHEHTIIQKIDIINNEKYQHLFQENSNVYRVGLQLSAVNNSTTTTYPYVETTILNISGTLQILLAQTLDIKNLSTATSILPYENVYYPGFILDPINKQASICLCNINSTNTVYPNPKLYTTLDIPKGHKACEVQICGNELTSSLKVNIYEGFVCSENIVCHAQGNVNSIIKLCPGICNKTCTQCNCEEDVENKANYLIIEIENVIPKIHCFYGGYVNVKLQSCEVNCNDTCNN